MTRYLIILLLFSLSQSTGDWQLKKEKDGISIYTRKVEGSNFLEFKAITTIDKVLLMDVLDILLDVENYDKLYADCMNPKLLKKEGNFYDIHYIQTKGVLTLKDRDGIYEQKTVIDNNGKHALVSLKPLPDYIDVYKNCVRIRDGSGFWELEDMGKGTVKVIYQFHGEPGGEIPAWLVNRFVVSHPLKTIKNLKERLNTNLK